MSRIVEGDAGKAICKEAENVKPIAVVMGTRGRSLMQRYYLEVVKRVGVTGWVTGFGSKQVLSGTGWIRLTGNMSCPKFLNILQITMCQI